jgi:hypothetical protein
MVAPGDRFTLSATVCFGGQIGHLDLQVENITTFPFFVILIEY